MARQKSDPSVKFEAAKSALDDVVQEATAPATAVLGHSNGMKPFHFVRTDRRGFELAVWDYVRPCIGERCPIWDCCPYRSLETPCEMEKEYIEYVVKIVYQLLQEDKITKHGAMLIGYHIIPLYKHLFKFKIYEMALETPFDTRSKKTTIHPIYKEIRNTIASILQAWVSVGVSAVNPLSLGMMKDGGTPALAQNYYDVISGEDGAPVEAIANKSVKDTYNVDLSDEQIDDD